MSNDLTERECGSVNVEVAPRDVQVGGKGAQVFEGVFRREVAETQRLRDLAAGEKFLELW